MCADPEQSFLLRDVLQQLSRWRGELVDVAMTEPEVGMFFAAFRATIDRLELDADLDASGGRLAVVFHEPGHELVLYADLVDGVAITASWHMEVIYRGGNLEMQLVEGGPLGHM